MALIFVVDDLDTTVKRLKERNVGFITEPQERPEWGIRGAARALRTSGRIREIQDEKVMLG
jgi:hypothetical protein